MFKPRLATNMEQRNKKPGRDMGKMRPLKSHNTPKPRTWNRTDKLPTWKGYTP